MIGRKTTPSKKMGQNPNSRRLQLTAPLKKPILNWMTYIINKYLSSLPPNIQNLLIFIFHSVIIKGVVAIIMVGGKENPSFIDDVRKIMLAFFFFDSSTIICFFKFLLLLSLVLILFHFLVIGVHIGIFLVVLVVREIIVERTFSTTTCIIFIPLPAENADKLIHIFACFKIIKQKQIFTCSRKHGSIPKGQFQWVFQTGQSRLFHFWPVSKGGSMKIDDSVCL